MVMIAPIRKQITTIASTLLLFTSLPPTPWPRGVMAVSAPSWKKPMPIISRTAPVRNNARVLICIGTSVTLKSKTIIVMGSTLDRDSLIFSFNFSFMQSGALLF
jgi:hypothetical protein